MTSAATSLPLASLSSLGTVKASGLQIHEIRQVSTIHAPNLTGQNGDLVLDSGSATRSGNGHVRVKGGVEGRAKLDALEIGVWDRAANVGRLTNSLVTAETIEEHHSVGTLLTALKVPIMGEGTMDESNVYALRNVGTQGHMAWASINDIGGNLEIFGSLSVSSNAVLAQGLSVGGPCAFEGALLCGDAVEASKSIRTSEHLSAGGRLDIESQLEVGGISLLHSSLSVATTGVFGDTLSVARALACADAAVSASLSVGGAARFEDAVHVAGDLALENLEVRGRVQPLAGGLSVSGEVRLAGGLSVGGAVRVGDALVVDAGATVHGANFSVLASSGIQLGQSGTSISAVAASFDIASPVQLSGHLSVGNSTGVVLDTPALSVGGSLFLDGDSRVDGRAVVQLGLSCAGGAFVAKSLRTGEAAFFGADVAVSSDLSVAGAMTVQGDLLVQGTTTTISSTTLTVQDKTLELGVVDAPSDSVASGSGIVIKGDSDKTILYRRSAASSATNQQMSAFGLSEDLVLDKKTKPFSDSLTSKLADSERSQVIHLGDVNSTDGHWMIVSDISNGKLQFWYGQDILDDHTMDAMPGTSAKLAFEINKP